MTAQDWHQQFVERHPPAYLIRAAVLLCDGADPWGPLADAEVTVHEIGREFAGAMLRGDEAAAHGLALEGLRWQQIAMQRRMAQITRPLPRLPFDPPPAAPA